MGFFSTFDIWLVLGTLAVASVVVLGGVSLLLRSVRRHPERAVPAHGLAALHAPGGDGGELVRLPEPAERHIGAAGAR